METPCLKKKSKSKSKSKSKTKQKNQNKWKYPNTHRHKQTKKWKMKNAPGDPYPTWNQLSNNQTCACLQNLTAHLASIPALLLNIPLTITNGSVSLQHDSHCLISPGVLHVDSATLGFMLSWHCLKISSAFTFESVVHGCYVLRECHTGWMSASALARMFLPIRMGSVPHNCCHPSAGAS